MCRVILPKLAVSDFELFRPLFTAYEAWYASKKLMKSKKASKNRVLGSYSYFDVIVTEFDGKKAFKPVTVTSKLL